MLRPNQLERHVKGFANRRRIQIMLLLDQTPDLSLVEIAEKLKANFKTIAEHTHRLQTAGLIKKGIKSNIVAHRLTERGRTILDFLKKLE